MPRPPDPARRRVGGLAIATLPCLGPGRAGAAPTLLAVGGGEVAVLASRDWSRPLPAVTRAVITIHGLHRDADAVAHEARALAGRAGLGTPLLTPRSAGVPHASVRPGCCAGPETHAWTASLPRAPRMPGEHRSARLRSWTRCSPAWPTGGCSRRWPRWCWSATPPAASSCSATPCWAVLQRAPDCATWSPTRPPTPIRTATARAPAAACPGYDRWKYGQEALPAHAGGASAGGLAQAYAGRDVT